MTARIAAFIVWGLVASSAVFWGLRASGAGPSAPPHATAAPPFAPAQADLRRVLGDDSAQGAAGAQEPRMASGRSGASAFDASRLRLLGVVATPSTAGGRADLALISLDGKPARTYRSGATIEADQVVQRIEARRVTIGPLGGDTSVTLELPALAAAAPGGPAEGAASLRTPRPAGAAAVTASPSAPNVSLSPQTAMPNTPAAGASADTADEEPTRPPRRAEPAVLRNPNALNR